MWRICRSIWEARHNGEISISSLVITAIRVTSLLVFLYYSLSITWQACTALTVMLASITLLKPQEKLRVSVKTVKLDNNLLKGKPKLTESDLPDDFINETNKKITEFVTYNATDCESVTNFNTIKYRTQCIFAKRAVLWGSARYESALSLEENTFRNIPTFLKFCLLCEPLGLDGFVFELPATQYGTSVEEFGRSVRQLLLCLSHHDPSHQHCMLDLPIDRPGWVFQFVKVTFFVTTFAPFYPSSSPRFSHGAENCFVLFQPEISFAQHDIPSDTPHTNWNHPKTVRDRIRVAFREAGRDYMIRDSTSYPMVHDIVKPLNEGSDFVKWWTDD